MLGSTFRQSVLRPTTRLSGTHRSLYCTQPKVSDPLRILFCGSDEFSCESLKSVHEEHQRNKELIHSIDVVLKPAKPTGRGLKTLREVPIKHVAQQLGLPIHERDTFTGWDMPSPNGHPINLIIAVSFGLFVPPRLLRAAKYSGLNIHPSLLPNLRGPAPIHHALLANHTHTGLSLQTLSPQTFDAGTILSQTPLPGIPIPQTCTLPQLHALLAPLGAKMLIDGLRAGLHIPPYHNAGWIPTPSEQQTLTHASKITSADRQVRWDHGRDEILRRARVLGSLWSRALPSGVSDRPAMRVIFEDFDEKGIDIPVNEDQVRKIKFVQQTSAREGASVKSSLFETEYFLVGDDAKNGGVAIRLAKGELLPVSKIKIEGKPLRPAWRALNDITRLPTGYNGDTCMHG